ncbi:hypothetical protein HCB26_06350 [Listeria booriae]|uniref:Uncharacterized protein n=1 Tax=Listeria booriae TaxID=1552123 RepID=A0A7X0YZ26_9LIST|nr:hypothetical protein [Listeria booriae]MBC2166186.1 hypothetical protein [Listeria booriae]
MPKLTISKELDKKITEAIEKLAWYAPYTNLDKMYAVSGYLSDFDLYDDGLTAKDIFDLATGNYSVKKQYEVGRYYISTDMIFKVLAIENDKVKISVYHEECDVYINDGVLHFQSDFDKESRPATSSKVKLFNRVEQFHAQGRKLNQFREGDVVRDSVGNLLYYRNTHASYDTSLTLVCTKEKRGDL